VWAQDAVAAIEAIATSDRLSVQELVLAGGDFRGRADAPIPVGAEGVLPFYVRVDASVDLTTLPKLDAYLESRRGAFADLTREDGTSLITAALGFSERPGVGEVLDLVRAHDGVVEQVILDATIEGRRIFTQIVGLDAAKALTGSSNDEVGRRFTQLVQEMEQPLCGASAADIEWRVRAVRISLTSADAAALASEPAILLVDPLDDVTALYRGQAATVNVGAWPNVTIASEELAGKPIADAICEEES
jgi:hypothetical protein